MERCINQVFRPKMKVIVRNRGDCTTCQPCKNNIHCSGYYPIGVFGVEVRVNGNANFVKQKFNGERVKHLSSEISFEEKHLETIES
jgi:hypothetical protein